MKVFIFLITNAIYVTSVSFGTVLVFVSLFARLKYSQEMKIVYM